MLFGAAIQRLMFDWHTCINSQPYSFRRIIIVCTYRVMPQTRWAFGKVETHTHTHTINSSHSPRPFIPQSDIQLPDCRLIKIILISLVFMCLFVKRILALYIVIVAGVDVKLTTMFHVLCKFLCTVYTIEYISTGHGERERDRLNVLLRNRKQTHFKHVQTHAGKGNANEKIGDCLVSK